MNDRRLLRLHPTDNVLTVIVTIETGAEMVVEDRTVRAATCLPLGHKIASAPIAAGEKVLKYGAPIGSATCDIALGQHVHTHNLRSDYLPTWLRENQQQWFAEQHAS